VFDGRYVTGDITEAYLSQIEETRNDAAKSAKNAADGDVIDLHNNS
jgi:amidophosphoribosyltransferase